MMLRRLAKCCYASVKQQLSISEDPRLLATSGAPTSLASAALSRCPALTSSLQRSFASRYIAPKRLAGKAGPVRPLKIPKGPSLLFQHPQGGAKRFSAASSKAADAGQQRQTQNGGIEGYVFKGLLFATILAIGLKLGPHIAAGNVTHAVRLLDAETPFMQSSGAKRIRRLAATGMAGKELRRENAPAKLLGLLHEGADPGVSKAVVEALEAICKEHEGMEATIRAGGTDVLQEAVDQGWLGDLLAREVAASLLVGLKIQEGHLD